MGLTDAADQGQRHAVEELRRNLRRARRHRAEPTARAGAGSDRASSAARAIRKAEGRRRGRARYHHAPSREENRTQEAAMTIPSGEASAAASRRESRLPGQARESRLDIPG